jgi:hypothetical protein
MTSNRLVIMNHSSLVSCLPGWATKTIEAARDDVGDASSERQTSSQKQHVNIFLMTCILETCDPISYSYAKGKPKWGKSLQTKHDFLSKNHIWDLVPQPQGKNM